ncbi:hypothetical protein [Streptomyces sp. NPDC051994]|uniref:hypothetical protein n=1 Tax=unclassified Streptomyces TaxID=2593676 RepID=UPI003445D012
MNRVERVRMIGQFTTGAGLVALACAYAQGAVWPVAALLGVGAVVCADGAFNVQEKARELHAATHRDPVQQWAQAQAKVREALADETVLDTGRPTVHACPPDGTGLMPCCGRTPFELGELEQLSGHGPAVTCSGTQEADRA